MDGKEVRGDRREMVISLVTHWRCAPTQPMVRMWFGDSGILPG